jgi:membrane protein DedA with SNARE-associated domain
MLELLSKYGFIIICIMVLLEELGVPMPVPTDLLIVFAGVKGAGSWTRLGLWFIVLNIASATGASGLYLICRRGGRPLVERFGRYVHLGPQQLARSEVLLQRSGWLGIAVGRAIPGLRYVTVIACGLLNVPYLRFLTAHVVGSSVYIAVFMALGAAFGPAIIARIHAPELMIRLLWLLALALGLPLLLVWLCYRGHAEHSREPSRRRLWGSVLLASFVGTTALAAAWATAAALAQLLGMPQNLNVTEELVERLLNRGLWVAVAYMVIYTMLLLLCVAVGMFYYDLLLPRLAPRGASLGRQVLGLTLLGTGLVTCVLLPLLLLRPQGVMAHLWRAGGPLLALTLGIGILDYAITTVYGRALAIAVLPSLRREPAPVVREPVLQAEEERQAAR